MGLYNQVKYSVETNTQMLCRLLLDNISGRGITIFITTLSGPNGTSRFYRTKLGKNISFTFEVQIHTYSTKQQYSIKFLSVILCKTKHFLPSKLTVVRTQKNPLFFGMLSYSSFFSNFCNSSSSLLHLYIIFSF